LDFVEKQEHGFKGEAWIQFAMASENEIVGFAILGDGLELVVFKVEVEKLAPVHTLGYQAMHRLKQQKCLPAEAPHGQTDHFAGIKKR
jgi:hypothetical protein